MLVNLPHNHKGQEFGHHDCNILAMIAMRNLGHVGSGEPCDHEGLFTGNIRSPLLGTKTNLHHFLDLGAQNEMFQMGFSRIIIWVSF